MGGRHSSACLKAAVSCRNIMKMILGFLPFIAFSLLSRYSTPPIALGVGALIAAALVVRTWLSSRHRFNILDVGTVILMAGLALYTTLASATLSIIAVRLSVDVGLLLIVVFSMLLGRPFTLHYAREQVAPAYWNSPRFVRTNYVITTAWAIAFAMMVVAEAAILMNPAIPLFVGFSAIVLALIGVFSFTAWYSQRARQAASA